MSEPEEKEEKNAQYFAGGGGPDRNEMVHAYLPGSDEWSAKTLIDLNDPARIAALRAFGEMFPEVDDLQPLIDEFLHEFLKSKTSVRGKSREEYQRIFESMFGGHPEQKKSGLLLSDALAADLNDD